MASVLTTLLNVAWYLVAIGLILSVCLLAVSPWVGSPGIDVDLKIPVSFSLDAGSHRVRAPLGVDAAQIEDLRGSLRFSPRRASFVAGSAVVLIVMLALVLWVLGQLRAVFRTLRDGQPFVPANATRVRRIGWAVIVGELARSAVELSTSSYAMSNFSAEGLRFDARPDLNIFVIVNGLIILVIAEVFRAGTRLDEDQSLTV